MSTAPYPGAVVMPKPSVGLYRLPNTPDAEDHKPGYYACESCGSESVYGEHIETVAQTWGSPSESVLVARCHDCEEIAQVSRLDLHPDQYPAT
jgi:hypothetical protein